MQNSNVSLPSIGEWFENTKKNDSYKFPELPEPTTQHPRFHLPVVVPRMISFQEQNIYPSPTISNQASPSSPNNNQLSPPTVYSRSPINPLPMKRLRHEEKMHPTNTKKCQSDSEEKLSSHILAERKRRRQMKFLFKQVQKYLNVPDNVRISQNDLLIMVIERLVQDEEVVKDIKTILNEI